jgi:hypothetical protein
LVREIQSRALNRTAEELAGADATPVEKLLAQRAALCWHVVHHHEMTLADRSAKGVALALSSYLQRTIDGAHRRLLQTIRTLELVRRLARPRPGVSVSVSQHVSLKPPATPPESANQLTIGDLLAVAPNG